MIINKDSWHYKVVEEGLFWSDGSYPSNSLCLYFWQVVGRVLSGVAFVSLCVSPLVLLMTILGNAPAVIGGLLGFVVAVWSVIRRIPQLKKGNLPF